MSRVIDAILRLRDEFTKPMQQSLDLMTSASKQGERTRKSIDKFGKSMQSVGKTLTTSVTLPIVGAGAAAVKTAAGFEQSMAQVQATMGVTTDATSQLNGETVNTMGALSDLAKEMGKTTKFSASEAAAAINNLAMAGYDVQKTYDTLPTVLSLASAGALDLDYATQLVANGMAVMGESAGSAQRMADMMAVTASNAYGSVADFGEGLLVAGGQAAVCGQSIEDTYTALGILGDAGIQGSEGGTALRNVMKNLYQPTDKAAKVLKKLGIQTSDSEGNLLSMQDVLQQVNAAMSSMNDAEISTTMAEIFDTRSIAAASALLGNADDRWNSLRETIAGASDMYDGQGAAAGMAATQLNTFEGRVTILKSSLEGLAISFGEILLPYVEKGAAKLQELVDKFNSLDDEQKQNIVRIAAMAAAAGPLIVGFGKLISLGSTLFGVIARLRGAFTAVSQAGSVLKVALAALGSPIAIVIAAIAGIIAIIGVVITHLDMFKEAGGRVMGYIGAAVAHLQSAFGGFAEAMGPIISKVSDLLAVVLVGAFEGAGATIAVIIDALAVVIEGITDVISGVVSFVSAVLSGDWASAWQAAQQVVEGVFRVLTGIVQGFLSLIGGIGAAIQGAVNAAGKLTGAGGAAAGGGVSGHASGTTNFEGGWTRINEKGGEMAYLPSGTQIIPHEATMNTPIGGNISIAKLADQIVVREDADIDRIGDALVRKLRQATGNLGGWTYSGNMA